MPIWHSDTNRRAAPPSLVKIATPFPYGLPLTSVTASSYDCARSTDSTGPKISSV